MSPLPYFFTCKSHACGNTLHVIKRFERIISKNVKSGQSPSPSLVQHPQQHLYKERKSFITKGSSRSSASSAAAEAAGGEAKESKAEEVKREEERRLDSPLSSASLSSAFGTSRSISSISSSSIGTPNPPLAAASYTAASRFSRSSISVVVEEVKEEVEEEEERRRGRTTAELNRLCELLEEERSKSAERNKIGRRGVKGGRGGDALEEEEEEAELREILCSPSPSPSLSTTPLRRTEDRNLERSGRLGINSSGAVIQKRGAVQIFEDLSAPSRFCDVLPPPPPHSSSLPEEANCLPFERKEDEKVQRSSFQGLEGLLGELAIIGEPPPYFSPPSEAKEGEEEAVTVPEADFASSTTSLAKQPQQQDQQVSSSNRKEGLAGLVELARLSGISTTPGFSGTLNVRKVIQEKKQSNEIEEVEKKCIIVQEKETKLLKPWEYELFHGFSQERVCYVQGESSLTPNINFHHHHHQRSTTWEEDLLAGFSNLSLQNKQNSSNNSLTGEGSTDLSPNHNNSNNINFSGEGFSNPSLQKNHNNITNKPTGKVFSDPSLEKTIKSIHNDTSIGERFPDPTLDKGIDHNSVTGEGGDKNKVEDKHINVVGQQGDCHCKEEFNPVGTSTANLCSRDLLKSSPGKRAAVALDQQEKSFQSLCLSSFHSITDDCLETRQFLQSFVSRIPPPPPSCYTRTRVTVAPIDPHSYTDSSHPLTKHVALCLFLDFPSKIISGTATLTLERAHKGEIFLDTRDLTIESAEDSQRKKSLKFFLEKPDEIKGSLLRVVLEEEASVFSVTFKTSPSSSALQWLDPSQTAGEKLPYVFTQCQAIHARSIFPCQDTPVARIKYSAEVNVPAELSVVMSAAHVGRIPSSDSEARAIESFVMKQPIPPYLFALAAGDITYEEVGPRTRIYAEPSEVKAAAYEFANTEETVRKAETLFGPYDWERFDLLVMPPSFPYGGMENPRMAFLTPTIIVGDRSGVEVVAHELAHSWTGNLISNATANDFWLNEGFTTYAERRIIEAQDGLESLQLHIGIGWQGLEEEVERFKDRPEMTKLKMNLEGVDPDEIYSKIPYEKGFQFLRRLEFQVGRPTFDDFLKKYIAKFRFQSIDTETFLVFLKENLPRIEEQVDLQLWIHGTGIPDDAIRPKAGLLETVQSLADEYQSGEKPTAVDTDTWSAQAWIVYIERLPKTLSAETIRELEELYHFSDSPNWEIKIGMLTIGANSAYKPFYPKIQSSLHSVGRMKYLKPLYQGLLEGSSEGKELALKAFAEAKSKYHPIAQVVIQGLLRKHTSS